MGITRTDLENCRNLRILSGLMLETMEALRNQAERTTQVINTSGGGRTNKASDKVGKGAVKLADFAAELEEVGNMFAEQAESVCGAILGVTDAMQRLILYYRYVEGLEWIPIQKRTSYSRAQAYRIHDAGLAALGIKDEKDDTQ